VIINVSFDGPVSKSSCDSEPDSLLAWLETTNHERLSSSLNETYPVALC